MPGEDILKKYADVLVKFALGSGEGIKKGDVVFLSIPESAKPMLNPLQISVLEAGGHPVIHFVPEGTDRRTSSARVFYEHANEEQLNYVPKNYLLGRVEDCDHFLMILSSANPKSLEGIDPKKLMQRGKAFKFYMDARNAKEDAGKFTWTLALFGTEAMAKEAELSIEEYWEQIINACYLNEENPIDKWKEVFGLVESTKDKLNSLPIEWLHIVGEDVDLRVKAGKDRKWLGGSGRNIPSFELFISPDWRGTEGKIKFNQPLYQYGNLVRGIELEFKEGKVVSCRADENEQLLKDLVGTENADKIGEFSLTDKRFSKINKFMAETLYDENMGGEFGNTHIALGNAYHDSYNGDVTKVTDEQWKEMGYNESSVHTDIVSTTNRTVTATLSDGSTKVIYKDGMFQLD
jgi:aminopeptidase